VEVGGKYIRGEGSERRLKQQKGINELNKQVEIIHVDASKITDDDGNAVNLTSASALRRWLIKHYIMGGKWL
jgi:hypothetical protein